MARRSKNTAKAAKAAEASTPKETTSVRADKWLWAARCFKTRSQATDACNSQLCKVNDRIVKPGHSVKIGDLVDVECPGGRRVLFVKALAERRGPAAAAALLYEDRSPEPPPRELPEDHEHSGGVSPDRRPSKHERRQLRKIRGY